MRRRWFGLLGLALLAVALAFALRDLVAASLAPFLARWLNALLTLALALPPTLIWLLFVLLAAFVLMFALLQLAIWLADRPIRRRPVREISPPGPVEELMRWIEQSGEGLLFQQRLARRLARNALAIWGYGEVTALREMQARLAEQSLTAPPAVMAYLRLGVERQELEAAMTESQPGPWLPGWRARRSSPEPQLPEIIAFLEDNLEA